MPKGKRIEPLDLDEMASSSSLNGLMAFRESAPIGLAPIGSSRQSLLKKPQNSSSIAGPASSKATFSEPDNASVPIGLAPTGIHDQVRKETLGVDPLPEVATSQVVTDFAPIGLRPTGESLPITISDVLSQLSASPPTPKSRGKVIPATKVEDGHSATQNALYWYLWRKGRQVNGSRSHYVQAGYGQIQAALGIDRSNIQDAIRELQKKLALQVLKPSTVGSATVYEVFCCEAILEKRRTEGLIWAHRYGGRKVELLTSPNGNSDLTPIGLSPTGNTPTGLQPIRSKPGGGTTPIAGVGPIPTGGIGLTPIHLVRGAISNNEPSSDVERLRSYVESSLDQMDEDAAHKLILDCENRAGNQQVTVEQIINAVQRKLAAARKAHNPIGFLLTYVPKLFPLRSIATESVKQAQPEEDIEYLRQLLENPDATEPMREQAKDILSKVVGQGREK